MDHLTHLENAGPVNKELAAIYADSMRSAMEWDYTTSYQLAGDELEALMMDAYIAGRVDALQEANEPWDRSITEILGPSPLPPTYT